MKGMPSLKDMAVQKTKQTSVKTEDVSVTEEKSIEKGNSVIVENPVKQTPVKTENASVTEEKSIEKENYVKKIETEQDVYENYTTMFEHIFDLSDIRVVKPKRVKKNSGNGRHAVCVYLSEKEYTYADRVAKRHGISISSLLRILLINSK